VVSGVPDPEKVAAKDRLDPSRLIKEIELAGNEGYFRESVAEIVDLVKEKAETGDVIAVLSNGGFEGIHQKLLDVLDVNSVLAVKTSL
jgi:UDP-N-acetylmuramate: L-alanyl-gamma-D-glutamyl-meso-diaminopimelate ligase